MTTFLLAAAAFVLLLTAVGLKPLLRARGEADRIMAVQLLGSGGIAALLLFAEGAERYAAIDVSLTLALLAAFVSVALAKAARRPHAAAPHHRPRRPRMRLALDLFTIVAVLAGAFFFLAGTVGLLRFPDTLTRLHALSKADNLGLGLIVLGLLPRVDSTLVAVKLVCVWLLVLLSGATVAQLIARVSRDQDSPR